MADVIHKTTMEIRESVNTPDYPAGTWLANPIWNPDKATIKAVPQGWRKITGGDTAEEMTAGEKLDNPLAGVDGAAPGSYKDVVLAATTGALPAHTRSGNVLTADANGALAAQDGETLTANQRLLVKNEGSGTHLENGPYIVMAVGDGTHPWKLQRAADFDSDADACSCVMFRVEKGTVNAGKKFFLVTPPTITLNMTALTFQLIENILQQVQTQTGAVNTGTTVLPGDDTIPQKTEGDEYMTLAITPKSAGSQLKVDVVCVLSSSAGSARLVAALFKDAVADAIAAGVQFQSTATGLVVVSFTHREASVSTALRTYKVRAGVNGANTTTFNGVSGGRQYGGVLVSSITITEIG